MRLQRAAALSLLAGSMAVVTSAALYELAEARQRPVVVLRFLAGYFDRKDRFIPTAGRDSTNVDRNAVLGIAVAVAMEMLKMPNPLFWGALAGLLNFVPYLGSVAGIVVVALAAFVSFKDTGEALLPPAAYFGITAIEGNVITPVVLGRAFRISPLIIFIWLVFWAWLWGVVGALIAVPLLVLVKITCEQSDHLAPVADFLQR